MTPADLIADARAGRTDEQALVWLAEMVLTLRGAASAGMLRARQGETPALRLGDKEPVG
jgi:hypothetical protein